MLPLERIGQLRPPQEYLLVLGEPLHQEVVAVQAHLAVEVHIPGDNVSHYNRIMMGLHSSRCKQHIEPELDEAPFAVAEQQLPFSRALGERQA